MNALVFVTGNERKLLEARGILAPLKVDVEPLDLPELQGSSDEIAAEKAKVAFAQLNKPLFVEDTSLHINALGGLPGPYIKHFLKSIGNDGILKMLSAFEDRSAVVRTTIGYCLEDGTVGTVYGEMPGTIVEARGTSNFGVFGFDPIFLPEGFDKTYAEMSNDEKNAISHRRKALEALRNILNEGD